MAWHLPVVATDVGGVSEVVSDEQSAILVPPHDPQLLAAALARMLEDPLLRQRLAEAAAARVTADFSPQSYTRSLIELYSELVQPRVQSGAAARIPA
jgi:glycosyltransferase involved in cell wall biosynthesis